MLRTGDEVLYYENGEERNGTIAFGGSAYHPEDVDYLVDGFQNGPSISLPGRSSAMSFPWKFSPMV